MPAQLSLYLDILRVAAALTVFLGHFAQGWLGGGLFWQATPYGHPAVIVFFVLSGYVIAYSADTRESTLRHYAAARLARVYSVALPTLIIALVLLLIGPLLNPAQYAELDQRGLGHTPATLPLQFLAGLFFLGESWGLHVRILGNTPYWSLAYEVWYYILFGCLVFLRGWHRPLATFLACLIAGPKILLMAPIWLAGVAAWHWRNTLPARSAWPTAILSAGIAFWLASETGHSIAGHFSGPWWPMEFRITDPLLGLAIALHLLAIGTLAQANRRAPPHLVAAIQPLAGMSFSLYLLHYPLLVFYSALIPGPADQPIHRTALLIATLLTIALIARFTEQQRTRLKTTLRHHGRNQATRSGSTGCEAVSIVEKVRHSTSAESDLLAKHHESRLR